VIIRAKSFAKVNLHLEVLQERGDGYHEIETILQTIELHDRLELRKTDGPIHIACSNPAVPSDRSNLCHRAAKLLRSHLGVTAGVSISLEKRIPVAAGLGGGSSNAAACLLTLPALWGVRDVDRALLHEIACTLGADVPYFLEGGTQIARGIGTELTPVPSSGMGWFLILKPDMQLSTADVYSQLRMGLTRIPPKVNLQNYKALLSRFPDRQWPGSNRLADVVFPANPTLHRLYLDLLDTDPRLAMLSGSGPSLFAVYSGRDKASRAQQFLARAAKYSWLGRSTRHGVTWTEVAES
jgi:4-diphosphocytidyl-2-C-methyl-D-erythritol kinase